MHTSLIIAVTESLNYFKRLHEYFSRNLTIITRFDVFFKLQLKAVIERLCLAKPCNKLGTRPRLPLHCDRLFSYLLLK